jgi:hypothetical protein
MLKDSMVLNMENQLFKFQQAANSQQLELVGLDPAYLHNLYMFFSDLTVLELGVSR